MLGSISAWIRVASESSAPIRSFSAVTLCTSEIYSSVLPESIAKDSARTSISSCVRYSSSIRNSRSSPPSERTLPVMASSGLTMRFDSIAAAVTARMTTTPISTMMVALALDIPLL